MARPTDPRLLAELATWGRYCPDLWIERVFDITLTPDQRAYFKMLPTVRRVHLRSGHALGKTFALASTALWWGATRMPWRTITTAAVGRQVRSQIWSEMPRLWRRARVPLPGELQSMAWTCPDGSGATGFTTDHPDRFTGAHDPNMLVLLDEGHGVDQEIVDAVKTSLQSPGSLCVFAGNPVRCEGAFWDEFKTGEWETVHFDAWRHPNVVQRNPHLYPGAVTAEWLEQMAREWGEDSPRYIARVRGEFPEGADFGLFSHALVREAMARELPSERVGECRLGVDVAWQGEDLTVFVVRDDAGVRHMESVQKQDPIWTADRVFTLAGQYSIKPENVAIDMTGIGSGTVAHLHRIRQFHARGVNFAEKARDSSEYANVKTEMYFNLADALKGGMALPQHDRLLKELAATGYGYERKGTRYEMEEKAVLKKRLGHSPDFADALALTTLAKHQPFWYKARTELRPKAGAVVMQSRSRYQM